MHAKSLQLHLTLCDPMGCSQPGSSVHGDSPGKNTGLGCHVLLQGIFPTQELNPSLLHLQVYSLPLHHLGSTRICLPKISSYQKESACAVVKAEKLQDL